ELNIIKEEATTLVSKLQKGLLTAKQVTLAFYKTAAIAHQIICIISESSSSQPLKRAEELDTHYLKTGATVSLKDQFHVKGNDTTMGYVGWIDTYEGSKDKKLVHQVNSQIVSELLDQGAILFCKTILPQTLLLGETINNIIGTTLNPNNRNLSCGGSSGGEGAFQALRGSLAGWAQTLEGQFE
ncbi:amidase signature enzyme, partial [Periconia macrospinosa]